MVISSTYLFGTLFITPQLVLVYELLPPQTSPENSNRRLQLGESVLKFFDKDWERIFPLRVVFPLIFEDHHRPFVHRDEGIEDPFGANVEKIVAVEGEGEFFVLLNLRGVTSRSGWGGAKCQTKLVMTVYLQSWH